MEGAAKPCRSFLFKDGDTFFQIGNQKAMNNSATCAIVAEPKGDSYCLN
jgi:hypothetical protein